jgi:hypothetical protein
MNCCKITIKNNILIINFKGNKKNMNTILDPISNKLDGKIQSREGHNFPVSLIPKDHILAEYHNKCKYVIGVYNMNSMMHEMLHAKYYMDEKYRTKINSEWENLSEKTRNHITNFLKKLGYNDNVIVDEYQAYRYTEANNFFGIKLE